MALRINLDALDTFHPDASASDSSYGDLQSTGSQKLGKLIAEQVPTDGPTRREAWTNDIFYDRPHRAILVEGGRGSGKTTFLLTQLQRIKNVTKLSNSWDDEERKAIAAVHVLPIIDPTLIETKDNIIILIVQMIERAIDTMERQSASTPYDLEQLDQAREALAEGLTMLDGIGPKEPYGATWEDAHWVMSQGLRKAEQGRSFERNFNTYLEYALNILGKKAFVLAFDDVDTNFHHGHVILETIRKYLTSRQLIIILSGDLDLYGRLIRRKIYDTFGSNLLKDDVAVTKASSQDLQTAVRELEEQYLLKILPPSNRIRMLPLGGLKDATRIVVQSDNTPQNDTRAELPKWMAQRIRKILGESDGTSHPFVDVVWNEHLRLVLSYLRALDLSIVKDPSKSDIHASRTEVMKVFETRLRMAGLSSDLIDSYNFNTTLRTTFLWMSRQEEPATLVRFGTPAEPSQAIILHCLALALAQGLDTAGSSLKALFTYSLPVVMLKRPQLSNQEQKQRVFDYLWGQFTPFLPETAARLSAIDRADQAIGRIATSSFGSIGLARKETGTAARKAALARIYGIKEQEKAALLKDVREQAEPNRSSIRWLDLLGEELSRKAQYGTGWFAIETLLESNRCGDFSSILNLIFFKRYSERGEIFRSISALSLLAVIGELLMSDTTESMDELTVDGPQLAFGNIESYQKNDSEPQSKVGNQKTKTPQSQENNDDEEEDEEEGGTENLARVVKAELSPEYQNFCKNMQNWHAFTKRVASASNLSPSMLGTLATRLHDDLSDLDREVTSRWGSGDILHRQITNILNAIVAVTSEISGRKESPKTSDTPLITALGKADVTLHPIAVILLSCPLIWAFLDPKPSDETKKTSPLFDAAYTALRQWEYSLPKGHTTTESEFEMWLTPPKIDVIISKITKSDNQRSVATQGFFDLLNVVMRYADDSK